MHNLVPGSSMMNPRIKRGAVAEEGVNVLSFPGWLVPNVHPDGGLCSGD
jgi:hypothetical protein